jgi:hypothetical protein
MDPRRWLREPLVQFLLLGGVLFLLGGRARDTGPDSRDILVDPAAIELLVEGFRRTWQRPPTRRELDALVEAQIREEVFYREAVAMGLDADDAIIRRRMKQKLEFLTQDLSPLPEPDAATLQAYLDEHADRYRLDTRHSFDQVFLAADRDPTEREANAEALLARLRTDPDTDFRQLGDPTLLDPALEGADTRRVARAFGREFALDLADLPLGEWRGPVESAYGLHLVRIRERIPGRVVTLEEARDAVLRDYQAERQAERNEEIYRRMRDRYRVEIEWPTWADPDSLAGNNGA